MSQEESLRQSFVSLEVNDEFSEATLIMRDRSQLMLCHRVGERWVKAETSPQGDEGLAGAVLASIARFRLNAKHLEIQFDDGSRWEFRFRGK